MGRYSEGEGEAEAPLGMGVMLALRQQDGKLPDFRSNLNITANLGAITVAQFLKNRGKKPCGSVPPYALRSQRNVFSSLDLKAIETSFGNGKQVKGRDNSWLHCF